jgi:hypothetical protein
MELQPFLDDLSRRIDPQQEADYRQAWLVYLDDECTEDLFIPPARTPANPTLDWPDIGINDAIEDYDAMALSQFKACSDILADGGRGVLDVRCNYGTGILPTLFGCDLFMMDAELNTLPTALPLHSEDKIKQLLDAGVPDLNTHLGGKVFECGRRYKALLDANPTLAEHVEVYHPDLQGPIDVAEVVWGSEIFLALLDQPDLVKQFLELVTETYIGFLKAWFELFAQDAPYACHWGGMHKGWAMLRNDSLVNLSPEMYVEFVRPLDQRIFETFGGMGSIHYCGRGEHFIEPMSEMNGLTSIWMSQPELNDMDTIYRHTVDKGIKLTGLDWEHARRAGRPLKGQVQSNPG